MAVSTLSLEAFARKLASAEPTPGGGSASAAAGSMAAALLRMVALLTSSSPKHAAVAERARQIAEDAEKLRAAFVACVDEDVAAFDQVTQAYRLPKSSESEKNARSASIQNALAAAADPPSRVVQLSLEASTLAASLIDIGNPNAVSDIGCAALCAHAAAQGAAFNVRINVKGLKDQNAARRYTSGLDSALAQIDLLTEVVFGKVQADIDT